MLRSINQNNNILILPLQPVTISPVQKYLDLETMKLLKCKIKRKMIA